MSDVPNEKSEVFPESDNTEKALEIGAIVTSVIPWLGGPVSSVLGGMSQARKWERVQGVLESLIGKLEGFKSEVAEKYVETEEFEDLLERTLLQSANELREEKRKIYAIFLAEIITSPGGSYDELLRHLRSLEELQPDHIRLMKALRMDPTNEEMGHTIGSPRQTLEARLPKMGFEHIADMISQLNNAGVTNLENLTTMMTPAGATNLQNSVTPYGRRLLQYIMDAD